MTADFSLISFVAEGHFEGQKQHIIRRKRGHFRNSRSLIANTLGYICHQNGFGEDARTKCHTCHFGCSEAILQDLGVLDEQS